MSVARGLAVLALMGVTLTGGAATDASEGAQDFTTTYDFYLGGLWAGEMIIGATDRDESYRATAQIRSAGVVGALYGAKVEAETSGTRQATSEGHARSPERFGARTKLGSKRQSLSLVYDKGRPSTVEAVPAFDPRPWQVDPKKQVGATDPLTAAVSAFGPQMANAVSNRATEVFDGRRRYAIELGAPATDGERVRCPAVYRRVAGFKPKMLRENPQFAFNVWFDKRPDGLMEFVRASGDTSFGTAVILRRGG